MIAAMSAFQRRLAAIVIAGAAARLAYVLAMSRHLRGTGDSEYFHALGNAIADGRGFVNPLAFGPHGPTSLHPPLFPLVLAAASKLGADSYLAHRIVACAIGAAAIAAIGYLGRRVASERVGLIAAGIAAAYPVLIAADGAVMSETLYGLFVAVTLIAAYRLLESPAVGRAVVLGVAVALAALTRAEALLLLPLLGVPALWGRAAAAPIVAACAACAIVLTPWLVRDWHVFDRPVPISTNSGSVIAGANCDGTYHGRGTGGWLFECVPPSLARNEAKWQSQVTRHGLHYARVHAGRLPIVLPVRVLRSFDLYQPFLQARFSEGRQRGMEDAGVLVYWLLAPLAIYGAGLLRRRGRPLTLLAAPLVVVLLVSIFGYGIPRFRHPLEVVIVVLAAVAVEGLLSRAGVLSSDSHPDRADARAGTPRPPTR
jgi:4-amino-4-deoxy-L-arabinose transferase-like glycosyltransferase